MFKSFICYIIVLLCILAVAPDAPKRETLQAKSARRPKTARQRKKYMGGRDGISTEAFFQKMGI